MGLTYFKCSVLNSLAFLMSFGQVFTFVSTATSAEDWVTSYGYPLHTEGDSFTSAYLNVTHEYNETGLLISDKTEVGRYGGGYIGSASGLIVHVRSESNLSDHSGCRMPLRDSVGNGKLPSEPWIALIKRGSCNFEVKVDNAYKSNAVAVLVYNDRDSPSLDKMKLALDNGSKYLFIYNFYLYANLKQRK